VNDTIRVKHSELHTVTGEQIAAAGAIVVDYDPMTLAEIHEKFPHVTGPLFTCGKKGCDAMVCYERMSLRGRVRGRAERRLVERKAHNGSLRCNQHAVRTIELPISLDGIQLYFEERARSAHDRTHASWFSQAARVIEGVPRG
jgi:hypothetical protein